jgi:hypothetical protein
MVSADGALSTEITERASGAMLPTTVSGMSGERAEVVIERAKNVAIVDVSPVGTGCDYEIADTLADRGIPFIFSTGHMARELPDRHVGRPLVSKPMQSRAFAEAVRMALR